MPAGNVDVVKRWRAAFNERDLDAMLALTDPDVEWLPITSILDGTVYRGHEEMRQWVEELDRDWEVFELRDDEFLDLGGDRVLALGTWRAKGRGSGVELTTQPATWLLEIRDGLLRRSETFTDRAKAFRAAGIAPPSET